jgi:hypothetical protein
MQKMSAAMQKSTYLVFRTKTKFKKLHEKVPVLLPRNDDGDHLLTLAWYQLPSTHPLPPLVHTILQRRQQQFSSS